MYFESPGIGNTAKTLEIAFDCARERGVKQIVIASTTGHTARTVLEGFPYASFDCIVVTHNAGFGEPGNREFPEELRDELTAHGIRVLTGTMPLRGLGAAIREQAGYSEENLVANTLRMFSQGIKVCVEITAMAVDSGLAAPSDLIAVAGTGRGADTACLIKGDSSNRFFKIKVREILVKPREF